MTDTLYGSRSPTSGVNFDGWGPDPTVPRFLTAVTAIAWYNAAVLLILIFCVFKKYSGLYFWSLLITTMSVIPYATGEWMKDNLLIANNFMAEVLLSIGFVFMVPGQSLVLYSRLHIVTENRTLLRFIFWMVIVNAFALCIPTVTLNLHQHWGGAGNYTRAYIIMDKIELCVFTAQEVFISAIYLWEVHKTLKIILDKRARKSMYQLIAMNLVHLALDTALLTVGFLDFHAVQWTFKGFAYSIKLQLEFAILTQLVRIVKKRTGPGKLEVGIPNIPPATFHKVSAKPEDGAHPKKQDNIPREWRVSVGISEIVSPSVRERESHHTESLMCLGSVEMYPGRLE